MAGIFIVRKPRRDHFRVFGAVVLSGMLVSGCRMEIASVSFNSDQPYPAIGFRSRPPQAESDGSEFLNEPPEGPSVDRIETEGDSSDLERSEGTQINNQNRRNDLIDRGLGQ